MTQQNETPERPQGPRIAPGNKKTKRYSKRVIAAFLVGVACLIALITLQAEFKIGGGSTEGPGKNYQTPQQAGFVDLATSMRRDRRPVQVVQTTPAPRAEEKPQRIVVERPPQPTGPSLPRYYSNRDDAQAANTLRTLRLQALTAKPVAEGFGGAGGAAAADAGSGVAGGAPGGTMQAGSAMPADAAMAALMQQQEASPDPNGQRQKQEFLRGAKGGASMTPQGYSANIPIPRQFVYELKAGTIIPCILQFGINSDLPGSTMALVSENVWDSTGKHVLIPKGTKALGVYNSQVTFGQKRVQVVWNRLVFPNGVTLAVAGSEGIDQAGFSGLGGRVNEHWGEMFKAALLASVFVAGAEVVYSEDTGGFGNDEKKSPRDVAAESLAGSIVDMGAKLMNRASDIQPTITVQPGKRMNIFLTQDYPFPFPYF